MIRARFYINKKDCGNDYRPVKWPIKYPYWCTGESSDCFIIDYGVMAGSVRYRTEGSRCDRIYFSFPKAKVV